MDAHAHALVRRDVSVLLCAAGSARGAPCSHAAGARIAACLPTPLAPAPLLPSTVLPAPAWPLAYRLCCPPLPGPLPCSRDYILSCCDEAAKRREALRGKVGCLLMA